MGVVLRFKNKWDIIIEKMIKIIQLLEDIEHKHRFKRMRLEE